MNNEKPVSTASKIMALLLVVVVVIASVTFFYFVLKGPCCDSVPSDHFGDEMLNGTYSADAYAVTIDGYPVGEGIETMADPPTVVFDEDFEGVDTWTTHNANTDSTVRSYGGTQSAYLSPGGDSTSWISFSFSSSIAIDLDETAETYFYIFASSTWDSGDSDYFVLKVNFDDGNTLVYVMLGSYLSPGASEEVVDVSTQVTAKGMWVGINIQRIDDDYLVQFGESLPISPISSVEFSLKSTEGENVYVDEMEIASLPKPYTDGSFWKKVPSGEKVSSYFIMVDYMVMISGDVDPNSVHVEFKLWMEIYDGEDIDTKLLDKTLIQDEIIQNVLADTDNTWNSKVFALPDDDTDFGDNLLYSFYILVEAWGELESEPGTFIYASADNEGEMFDSLHFEYVLVDGTIDVVITAFYALGSIGSVATIVGIVRRKKKSSSNAVDLKMNEKEMWYN